MMKENARRMHGSARKNCKILHQSLILRFILHPILHPECPVNTKGFTGGCRKCRFFLKNFFCRGREAMVRKLQNIGLLWHKVRMFCIKSTDVSVEEVRCFYFPEKCYGESRYPTSLLVMLPSFSDARHNPNKFGFYARLAKRSSCVCQQVKKEAAPI